MPTVATPRSTRPPRNASGSWPREHSRGRSRGPACTSSSRWLLTPASMTRSTTEQACAQIGAWLESPSLVLISEGSTHWATLSALLTEGKVAGPLVHDARIAALCLAHGVTELWTID